MNRKENTLYCFEKLEPEPIESLFKWLTKYKSIFIHVKQFKIYEDQLLKFSISSLDHLVQQFFIIFNNVLFSFIVRKTFYTWYDIYLKIEAYFNHSYIPQNAIDKIKHILFHSLTSI